MRKLTLPEPFEVANEDIRDDMIPLNMELPSMENWDWFLHVDGKPKLYFNELLKLCSSILKAPLTKKYAPTMYLEKGFIFDEKHVDLKDTGFSGAKRVNVATGEYTDISDPLVAMFSNRGQTFTTRRTENEQFFMHGKDDSCLVEGSWYDWLCLVGNVLSSKTVQHNYPDLYQPKLKNSNY